MNFKEIAFAMKRLKIHVSYACLKCTFAADCISRRCINSPIKSLSKFPSLLDQVVENKVSRPMMEGMIDVVVR